MKAKEKVFSLLEIATKTAVGFLPSPFSAAFDAIYDGVKESVLAKRAEKWKQEVIKRLEKLEMEYDSLINNETFATSLMKSSEIAIKTESDDKRAILADALINSTINNFGEMRALTFLPLIEKYTILHIQIIKYLHDDYKNERFFNNQVPTYLVLFKLKFHGIDEIYLKKAIKDLQNDYLIEEFKDESRIEILNTRLELLTKLGNDFYDFLKPNNEE